MIKQVKEVAITKNIKAGKQNPLVLLAGPCSIESEDLCFKIAEKVKGICERLKISYVFKASFDKANRTSIHSWRGPGLEEGMKTLGKIKDQFDLGIVTDIHLPEQAQAAAEVCDILQIPAFLCRQTDLLVAAAKTDKTINVKKGQFLAPQDMKNVVKKLEESGSEKIMLTERGNTFGYNNLVVDMRSLPQMRDFGYPVIFDATHSVQQPGGQGTTTGGDREMVPYLLRGAAAVGLDGMFLEVHPDPDKGLSDAANMVYLDKLEEILKPVIEIDHIFKNS